MRAALMCFVTLTAAAAFAETTPIDYRFDAVKRTVVLKSAGAETPAAAGVKARSGDRVTTGWFAYALIAAEQPKARFEIYGSTDVQLAGSEPGILLSLERGRLHAIFDKITGSEPRIVKTPGALLAVRGTQYSVSVDNQGRTVLGVFEGTVEVRSPLRPEPFFVRAGEAANFSRRQPPAPQPMPHGMFGAPRDDHGRGNPPQGDSGNHPPDQGHGMPGTQRPPNQPPNQPPSQPPTMPPPMRPPGGHH